MVTHEDFEELRERPAVMPPDDFALTLENAEAMREKWRAFWGEEEVDYNIMQAWCVQEAQEDMTNYALPPLTSVFAAVAAAYEMGFMFGWLLHKKAQARRPR